MSLNKNNSKQKRDNFPQHVAIIMDGNRRWAREHKRKVIFGHQQAAYNTIEPLADVAISHRIPYLTFWAFSTENWMRSPDEVCALLNLFRSVLKENIEKLHKKEIRIQTIGDLKKFPEDIQKCIDEGVGKTKQNTALTLTFALNYGGRDEILRAIEKIYISKKLCATVMTEEKFSQYLDTVGMPDPDLLIRTGGEKRLSGFLTWQSVYSELYFTNVLFPDFTPKEFEKALDDYIKRDRRFGK